MLRAHAHAQDLEGIIQDLARNAHPELLLTGRQTALTGLLTGSEYFAFHRAAEVIARAIVRVRVAKRARALAAMARTRRRLLLEVVDTELRFCAHTATIIKRFQVPMAALEGMDARAHAAMFPRALGAIHDLAARTCSLLSATPHAVVDVFVSQVPAYADAFQPFCDAYADASAAVRSAAAAGGKSKVAAFLEVRGATVRGLRVTDAHVCAHRRRRAPASRSTSCSSCPCSECRASSCFSR